MKIGFNFIIKIITTIAYMNINNKNIKNNLAKNYNNNILNIK